MKRALLVIDMQKGLFIKNRKIFRETLLIDTINDAIRKTRERNEPIVFIQHNSNQLGNGTADWEIHEKLDRQKTDTVFQKNKGDAFSNPDLTSFLREHEVSEIIVTGLVSHGCVRSTGLGGKAQGFSVVVVRNGHSNWNPDAEGKVDEVNAEFSGNGIRVLDTGEL